MKTYKKSQSGTACFEQREKSGAGSLANGPETGAFVLLRGSREPLVYFLIELRGRVKLRDEGLQEIHVGYYRSAEEIAIIAGFAPGGKAPRVNTWSHCGFLAVVGVVGRGDQAPVGPLTSRIDLGPPTHAHIRLGVSDGRDARANGSVQVPVQYLVVYLGSFLLCVGKQITGGLT